MDQLDLEDEVYGFICAYLRQYSHPPTLREIAKACHMSYGNVVRYLDRLEAHGRISRKYGKSRGITLLDDEPDAQ